MHFQVKNTLKNNCYYKTKQIRMPTLCRGGRHIFLIKNYVLVLQVCFLYIKNIRKGL